MLVEEELEQSDEEKEARKGKKRLWLLLLLLLLPIFFTFEQVSMYFYVTNTKLVEVPYNITREVTYLESTEHDLCSNVSHRYSYSSGIVSKVGNSVKPDLNIYNLENKWAFFRVKIYYVDNNRFPEEEYGGQNLFEKYESGEISEEDADFESPWYEFYLGPGEGVKVDNKTWMPDPKPVYWAMADIVVPLYEKCITEIEYYNVTENRTFTEHKIVNKKTREKRYMSVKEYLGISFGQWFVIIVMLILILFLIFRIYDLVQESGHGND